LGENRSQFTGQITYKFVDFCESLTSARDDLASMEDSCKVLYAVGFFTAEPPWLLLCWGGKAAWVKELWCGPCGVFPCPYCIKIAIIWVGKGQAVGTHGNMSSA